MPILQYEEVLSEKLCPNTTKNTFIRAEKLHITVGVMSLTNDAEKERAVSLLSEAKENLIEHFVKESGPITITMKGLSYMGNNSYAIDVLYGKVAAQGDVLQQFVDKIYNYFVKSDCMRRDNDHVKLHVTVLNTRYQRMAEHTHGRLSFDGFKILEKYGDYTFGEQELKQIQLSEMHRSGPDGYYKALSVIYM